MLRRAMPAILLAVAMVGAGCHASRHMMYVLFGWGETKTIEPVFADLPGQTVAVVVYADQKTQFEYPTAVPSLSHRVAAELSDKVAKVRVIDPAAVMRFQAQTLNWDVMNKTRIGQSLGADYVLFVSVMQYTTREPGSVGLYRGTIAVEATVYQTSLPERAAAVWQGEISATHPEDASPGLSPLDSARIQEHTERILVENLVKKFYRHKEKVTP